MSKKILIIRFGAIGDVVHSTVIQQAIKTKHPEAEIHFLTSELTAPLIENDKNLKKVYRFNTNKKDDFFYLLSLGLQFRKEKFDVIINLQNSVRNSFITLIANPAKVVYRSKNRVHAVDAFFNSAQEIFGDLEKPKNLNLTISEEAKSTVLNKIKDYKKPFIVINPGGENDNSRQGRIWPTKYWIELGNMLSEKYDGTIFITGSKNEREEHKELLKINSSILFSGEFSLIESAALFSNADLFISGDSGPLHMASALGVKTIGLMGSTQATSCGPYGEKGYTITADYDCIACGHKLCSKLQEGETYTPCMTNISPEEVINFIEEHQLFN